MSRKITQLEKIINRFHPVIYIAITLLATAFVIFTYYGVFLSADNSSAANDGITSTFDEDTIKKIEQLHSSDDPLKPAPTPAGRFNPFN